MKDSLKFNISKNIKGNPPRLPFEDIKNIILGKKYDLSLVFASNTLAKKLNRQYRDKDYIPNVLSFSLSKTEGEIFINLSQAKKECADFDMSYINFVAYLFIHASYHLKGLPHGSRMELEERKILKKFNLL